MRAISADDLIVLDASDEDTAAAERRREEVPAPSQVRTSDMDDSSSDEGFEILTPAPATQQALAVRSFEESLSVAELQAQQLAYKRLQKEAAQRSKTRSPVKKEKQQTKAAVSALLNPHPSPLESPKQTAHSNSPSTFSRESSQERRQEGSAREKRERRVPTSFSDFQAQEQEYSRLSWKKSRGDALPEGYPEQNHGGVEVNADTERKRTKAVVNRPKKPKRSDSDSSDASDDDDDDDDDDDFITEPEKTTDGTSDEDDDFYSPEPQKVIMNIPDEVKVKSEVKLEAKSLPIEVKRSKANVAKSSRAEKKNSVGKKKRKRRVVNKRQANGASGAGNNAFAASGELVSDILTRPRDAKDSVINTTCWRAVRFDDVPLCILPVPETVDAEFHSAFERPLPTFDSTGDLEEKSRFLSTFGEAEASTEADVPDQSQIQEEMDKHVGEAIEQELPHIESLYYAKARAIIAESRTKTMKYLEAHKTLNKQSIKLTSHPLDVSPTDKKLMSAIKSATLLRPIQTHKMRFRFGSGDSDARYYERPANVYDMTPLRPLSRSTAFIGLKANYRVEDAAMLEYLPYFGDQDDGEVIDVNRYDGIKSKDENERCALDSEIDEYLLRVIVRRFGDSSKVFTALKNVVGFTQGYSNYADLKKFHDYLHLNRYRIEEAKQVLPRFSAKLSAQIPLLEDEKPLRKEMSARLAPPVSYFDSNIVRNFADRDHGLGLRSTGEYRELCVTYRDLFCRMCYRYDCEEHGIEHPVRSHRADPTYPSAQYAPVILAHAQPNGAVDDPQVPEVQPCEVVDASTKGLEATSDAKEEIIVSSQEFEEISETFNDNRRRSSRSQTRISTLASASLKWQSARTESTRAPRTTKPKPTAKMLDESEYLDDSHFAMVAETLKQSHDRNASCSDKCWKLDGEGVIEEKETSSSNFTLTERLLIDKLCSTIGENACVIAAVLKTIPCREIHALLVKERMQKTPRAGTADSEPLSPTAPAANSRKRGRGRAPKLDSNFAQLKRSRYKRMKDMDSNHEYEPCNHEGKCNKDVCSCRTRDHTCDKACSCSPECSNRFLGCRCSLGNCRTKACPCFVAMRECNPDICITCGASEAAVLIYNDNLKHKSALELGICGNVHIQRGLHKKIGVAYSTTHGWGAFAREPIKRGEFIYEYHGALISQDEAERRGNIYDKMTISFLFDANEDSVVDAIRKGNKSKFANHASVGQKCNARVMRVNNEHRISIWAQQDIEKGEELFFDYGYHGESAPDWSQLRIKGARSRRKDE